MPSPMLILPCRVCNYYSKNQCGQVHAQYDRVAKGRKQAPVHQPFPRGLHLGLFRWTPIFLELHFTELICPNLVCMYVCVYVCMYVRHAQKIAKLFFSVRSTQFLFKLNILFIKKYINLLGPKTLR